MLTMYLVPLLSAKGQRRLFVLEDQLNTSAAS